MDQIYLNAQKKDLGIMVQWPKLKSRDELIHKFASLHLRRMELANILSKCRLSKPRKGVFRELKSQKFPMDPRQACTFDTHLGNR